MKIVVIGLGSMGKRRIRLIKKISSQHVIYGVDSRTDRREEVSNLYGIQCFADFYEIVKDVDAAFVCTSPASHGSIIRACLENDCHVFTEINLVTDYYLENIALAEMKNKILFLSSTMLYRNEILKIMECVNDYDGKVNYSYHVGQYLPLWHPWENYQDFFVGNAKTNGCREFLAIEMPWITQCFGEVTDVRVIKGKMSGLDIQYDDNYLILLEHDGGKNKGMLAIDVVSPKAVRNLEVYGENFSINWDGTPNGLYKYDLEEKTDKNISLYEKAEQLKNYNQTIVENAYTSEIETFFSIVAGNKKAGIYGFQDDLKVLRVVDEIEGIL